MRISILSSMVVIAACGVPVETSVGGRELSKGGTFDLRVCGAGVAIPASAFPARNSSSAVALAVCGGFQSDNTSTVDGDTRVAGTTRLSSPVSISGALRTGAQIVTVNTLNVGKDLSTAGDWTLSAPAEVQGSATIAGTLEHDNSLMVFGKLTASRETGSGALQAASVVITPTSVVAPLDCSGAPDAHAAASTVAANLDPRVSNLLDPNGSISIEQPTDLQFGCAQYVVAGLEVNNTLTVHIMGPTVWVIRGDVNIDAPMVIDITDGASLELIIDGALNVDNTLTIGDAAHPSLLAVAGNVRISSPTHLYGALLAPTAAVSAQNTLDVYGAMYVGSTTVASPLNVHEGITIGVEGWPMVEP